MYTTTMLHIRVNNPFVRRFPPKFCVEHHRLSMERATKRPLTGKGTGHRARGTCRGVPRRHVCRRSPGEEISPLTHQGILFCAHVIGGCDRQMLKFVGDCWCGVDWLLLKPRYIHKNILCQNVCVCYCNTRNYWEVAKLNSKLNKINPKFKTRK